MVKASIPEGLKVSDLEMDAYFLVDDRIKHGGWEDEPKEGTACHYPLQTYRGIAHDSIAVSFPLDLEYSCGFRAEYRGDNPELVSLRVELDCPGGEREAVSFAKAALGRVGALEPSVDVCRTSYCALLKQNGMYGVRVSVYPTVQGPAEKPLFELRLLNERGADLTLDDLAQEITEALDAELANPGSYSSTPAAAEPTAAKG